MKAESLKVMCSVDGRTVISDLPPRRKKLIPFPA